ncbi:MAG: APC family permease [Roseiflexaceae bacterium]
MLSEFKRLLVGRPLANEQLAHERLPKRTALAVFSSDALSSVAYATEAILIALMYANRSALGIATPIAFGITVLLITVAFSYVQTIMAYPNGGGSYIVSRENLGTVPSLIAAVSLMVSYILTVAVSISAGVTAITSALHWLDPYRVVMAVVLITLLTLANLRGIKESGSIFAVPTYLFIVSMFGLIIAGLYQVWTGNVSPAAPPEVIHAELNQTLTWFLILRAFASGCTALTGIEAISDGVAAFKQPQSRNAAITLGAMAIILSLMFVGITVLAGEYNVIPDGAPEPETVNSQLARAIFGGESPFYYVIQIATMLILILASNTAYADFPRLSYFLAVDRFLPRQFAQRGDRLVFSNGVIFLGVISAILVVIFDAREQAMLPLYALGVFAAFTLSQSGMVLRWIRLREPNWIRNTMINGFGATITGIVFMVIAVTKFTQGAWAVLLIIPLTVYMLFQVRKHYLDVAEQLSLTAAPKPQPVQRHTVLVLVSGVHRGVIPALQYGLSLTSDNIQALYIDMDDEGTQRIKDKWKQWGCGIELVTLPSPYRSLVRPIREYVEQLTHRYSHDVVTIVMPEFIPNRWWQNFLHNQTALAIKTMLLFTKNVVVVSVPYHLDH